MRIFQNKIAVGVICIIVAAILTFFLLPSINRGKNGTVKVIKLTQQVASGTKIEESMLEEKEVGGYGLPENTIKEKDQIIGKYSNCTIMPDDLILTSKLSDYAADQRLDTIMANGQMLVTVSVDTVAAGVGNHLRAGDIVSVISYADNNVHTYEELNNLEIYSIENVDAQNLEEASSDENAEQIASSVTLIVNQAQAEKLVLAEYSGKIHMVFVKRGAVG